MKKRIALLLVLALAFGLVACAPAAQEPAPAQDPAPAQPADPAPADPAPEEGGEGVTKDNIKIGVVHIMDLGDQGYSYNHDQGVKEMLANLGLSEDQYIPKFNIDDTDAAATNQAITELIDTGCQIIFATSFSYGSSVVEFAKEYPDIQFCHATGADVHGAAADLPNFHNYFAKIHQARYLGGIAAGMKTLETGNNKLGYVAAHPFAEVISGFTAFYLGAKSVNPDVTMDVMYINSWGDAALEEKVAQALIERGCGVISQHSDNLTPATAAEKAGVFHVGYNADMTAAAPKASLCSPRINWGVYMTYAVEQFLNGQPIAPDWSEGLASGAVVLSPLNEAIAAEGTQAAIDAAVVEIAAGKLIFKGALKDPEGNPAVMTDFGGNPIFTFENDDSAWEESGSVSAPSFNAIIEGISIITQ